MAETRGVNADDPGHVIVTGLNVSAVVLGPGLRNEPRKGPGLVKEKGGPGHETVVVKRGPSLGIGTALKGPDVQGLGSLNKKEAKTDPGVVGLRLKTSLTMVWVTMAATHRMGTTKGTILNRNVVRTMIVNRSTPIMEEEVEVMTMKGIEY